jgi:hypothetical protein
MVIYISGLALYLIKEKFENKADAWNKKHNWIRLPTGWGGDMVM